MKQYPKPWQLISQPSCLVGPAIWFQRTRQAQLHRQLLKKAWPTKPRWQWFLLLFASTLSWYLCFCWIQLYACLNSAAFKKLQSKGVGKKRQLCDLLTLGLWYGVKPWDYYLFRLYGVDRNRWSSYVFSQEQLTWLRVFSCPPDVNSDQLVNDKYLMEQALSNEEITTTKTVSIIRRGATVDKEMLFRRHSLFIKPNSANAMRGCLSLKFLPENNSYRLSGYDLQRVEVDLSNETAILEFIEGIAKQTKLLVQELLENSEEMSRYAGVEELVTIKAVTGFDEKAFSCDGKAISSDRRTMITYLILEVAGSGGKWLLYPVNPETGVPDKPANIDKDLPASNMADILSGQSVPGFDKLASTLEQAHQLVPDIKTLSWDLCLTDRGLCVIEANTGWGLVIPQQLTGIPLLETDLFI